ncbi:MAG: hypothetical protein JXA71_00775 [Chitinispirillaceae bacterium]|nr:hypothetical protein [Chitinispirillaceae bacterium]
MMKQRENLSKLFVDIVHCARVGDYAAAASLLNRALLLVQVELSRGTVPADVLAQATRHLDEMFQAQKRGDWVGFADALEFSFSGFWHDHFSAPC